MNLIFWGLTFVTSLFYLTSHKAVPVKVTTQEIRACH